MQIAKGAEPIFLKGGDKACLLIHGLTGSPSEMAYLAVKLNTAGFTVKAPLSAGTRNRHQGPEYHDMA